MAVLYFSMNADFESCTSTNAKIQKIDGIIDELFTTALKSVQTGNHVEYSLDTGQSIQKVTYRNPEEVIKAIKGYEGIRQMYVNRLIGNEFQQVDGKNLRRC